MEKKLASKSALFNQRLLVSLGSCSIGLLLALFAFASGNALAGDSVDTGLTVTEVTLPVSSGHLGTYILPVKTSEIDPISNLVGFQGDFTFDERVVTFQNPPVQRAGLTTGNWNVSGNVLPGPGFMRTLRISAFSNDFVPLSGVGTLFELRMTRVSNTQDESTKFMWAAPPNQFIFIDADLNTRAPRVAPPGGFRVFYPIGQVDPP